MAKRRSFQEYSRTWRWSVENNSTNDQRGGIGWDIIGWTHYRIGIHYRGCRMNKIRSTKTNYTLKHSESRGGTHGLGTKSTSGSTGGLHTGSQDGLRITSRGSKRDTEKTWVPLATHGGRLVRSTCWGSTTCNVCRWRGAWTALR
jgi:hypothetical protein